MGDIPPSRSASITSACYTIDKNMIYEDTDAGWSDPFPFLRGAATPEGAQPPYRRLSGGAIDRAPLDTLQQLAIPSGLRLEVEGDASSIVVSFDSSAAPPAPWLADFGRSFDVWCGDRHVDERRAPASGRVELPLVPAERTVIYLPERIGATIRGVRPAGGGIRPATRQPKWVAYGDSITQGWVASRPCRAWPAAVGRRLGLDVCNLGVAGSARGEIVVAERIAAIDDCALVTLSFGTNSWSTIPATAAMVAAQLDGFLGMIRARRPQLPIIVISPIVRPDAESRPNDLGATQAELRTAMEHAVRQRADRGDGDLHLVAGGHLVDPGSLPDGVHPDDRGHEQLAAAIDAAMRGLLPLTSDPSRLPESARTTGRGGRGDR